MVRFFVDPSQLESQDIILDDDNSAHARVLRLQEGEQVILCDGNGTDYLCSIQSIQNGCYQLKVMNSAASASEPGVKACIYMALPKADKLEHVIQKATELGAYEIVTFPSARCVSRPDEKSLQKKLDRWKKIAVSAAEQSGRGRIPNVIVLGTYAEALERAAKADKAILFYENEYATTLHMALNQGDYKSISLLTGPEGGLEEKEVLQAQNAGLSVCTLGKRILRCETAPLCALSAVMYATMEF